MRCVRLPEFSAAPGDPLPEGENEYLRAAAMLLQQMAAEVAPLAMLDATMARAIEALQRGVENLVPVVEFISTASEGPSLNELKQLAKARIARLTEELEDITHRAESLAQDFPG